MTGPLALGVLWLVTANLIGIARLPETRRRAALALIAPGIPLLGWITQAAGPLWGLAFLIVGAGALRWPLARPRVEPAE